MTITREQIEMYASAADATQTFEMDKGKLIAVEPEHMQELARMALAGIEAEPVGYMNRFTGRVFTLEEQPGADTDVQVYVPVYTAPQPLTTSERSELENYRNAQQVDSAGMQRDALRYRFLRDKDAFGDEDEPDLAGWDGLSELDGNAFDSAVDARILQSGIPLYTASEKQVIPADADVYAELHRLRAEIKGPDGFDTWKDAAIFERTARIKLGRIAQEIDYLTAMAAYHSEQWHKMSPITGYMNGWNACRASMLKDDDGNSPVIPDGWVMVPEEPTHEMLEAGDEQFGTYDVYRRMLSAAPQQESE